MCYLPLPASLVLELVVSSETGLFSRYVFGLVLDVFVPQKWGNIPLKHYVYASDITITSFHLESKYDIKMGPRCPSTMDPKAHSLENRKNTYA